MGNDGPHDHPPHNDRHDRPHDDRAREAGDDGAIELTNEFATVRVRKIYTRNGVRLDISSPRLGYSIRLDPLALESLTWQLPEAISKFLETPYGPAEGPPRRPPDA